MNPIHIENTDGLDPDSTRNVLIHDVYIRTGDDGIAIKSGWDEYGYQYGRPSENITIRDCNVSTPCAALATTVFIDVSECGTRQPFSACQ